jgi:hypothetical protein
VGRREIREASAHAGAHRPAERNRGMIRQRIADVILPWASAHASVWPSQHATHAELWDEMSKTYRVVKEARLYGEKMQRDRDETVQRCGADLVQILDALED